MDAMGSVLGSYGIAGLGLLVFGAVIIRLSLFIRDAFNQSVTKSEAREATCRSEVSALHLKVDDLRDGVIKQQHEMQLETNRLIQQNTDVIRGLGTGKYPALPHVQDT